ncbi:MAG: hypothetical protein K2M60_05780 [Lachnospiraceae bacterium]|nr:hypothetical protein [Lachnospiraceae bacterium]MDE6251165.1 hypothetical protein [Lachnospiraceae bacterium]
MGFKKLISPEFRISTEKFEITSGMKVECFSSRESQSDWCRVELASQFQDIITYEDMEKAVVEFGYEDDYDILLQGYCRRADGDYRKEIMIRDAMIKLERTKVSATFISCTPQDIIRYLLVQAGITDYKLSETDYGKKDIFILNRQNGIKAIAQVNSIWGIDNDFFIQNEVFYWGCKPAQETIYVLEESENIISLKKYGELFEIETLGVPWIHHSQEIEVSHANYSGVVKVEKTIIKSDVSGYTRMYIYFKGG